MYLLETTNTPIKTSNTTTIRKRGFLNYLKSSFVGAMVAFMSFSFILMTQPSFGSEKIEESFTIADATQTDIEILTPYMNLDILTSIDATEPQEIIAQYALLDASFTSVIENYFR